MGLTIACLHVTETAIRHLKVCTWHEWQCTKIHCHHVLPQGHGWGLTHSLLGRRVYPDSRTNCANGEGWLHVRTYRRCRSGGGGGRDTPPAHHRSGREASHKAAETVVAHL